MYQRVFYGKVRRDVNLSLPDLSGREQVALWPIAVVALLMGVAPLIWLNAIDPSVQAALAPFAQFASRMVGR
jgi:NADH:ubiquinone oxidoreductase subunit 4 (subunit M)